MGFMGYDYKLMNIYIFIYYIYIGSVDDLRAVKWPAGCTASVRRWPEGYQIAACGLQGWMA